MGDQHQAGVAGTVELEHQLEHGRGRAVIQVAGRLVAQHAGRVIDQRARHCSTLAFATGQFAGLVVQAMAEANRFQQRSRTRTGLRHCGAGQHHRHHHVFQRGEFRQQVVELVDETQRLVAQQAARGVRQRGHALTGDIDLARGGRIQPAQQVQQRALAGTGGADDRNRLACGHRQVQAIEHRGLHAPLSVGLAQRFGTDHFIAAIEDLIHSAGPPPAGCVLPARRDTEWPGSSSAARSG
ncbi:hypothetical protein D3C81_379690 [compost metagenome]